MRKLYVALLLITFPSIASAIIDPITVSTDTTNNFQITVSTTVGVRINDAFAGAYNYKVNLSSADGTSYPNPQTKAQFTLQKLKDYIMNVVSGYEATSDAETARTSRISQDKIDIVIP